MKWLLTWEYKGEIRREYYDNLQDIIDAFELEVTVEQYGTRINDGLHNRYFPGDLESSICVWFTMYNPSVAYCLTRIKERTIRATCKDMSWTFKTCSEKKYWQNEASFYFAQNYNYHPPHIEQHEIDCEEIDEKQAY